MKQVHKRYLKERGFDPEEIAGKWSVQGIALASRLCWRLFIPIHHQGNVVSWTTRSICPEANQRYIAAKAGEEAMPARSLLYGEDHARHGIIVVEGPLDAWRIGFGAVAALGVSYGREQVARMSKYPVRAICFDSDPKAQRRAAKLCETLRVFPGRTVRVELDAEDPGSASVKEIRKLRREFL